MHRGADVVCIPGKGELRRAHSPADFIVAFHNQYAQVLASQGDGGCQPVGSAADDHRVIAGGSRLYGYQDTLDARPELKSRLKGDASR